jgi:arsenate reductase (thioredoxin)
MSRLPTVLFVCLHGSAKSVIAARHLERLAAARGVAVRASSAGVEPDAELPPPVVAGLLGDGIDVGGLVPRALTDDAIAEASHVVVMGCDPHVARPVIRWDDVPAVSDGYDVARDAIVARVEALLDAIAV